MELLAEDLRDALLGADTVGAHNQSGFGHAGDVGSEQTAKTANAHDHCVSIWTDINGAKGLNFSSEIQKTIISDNFEYWLGNKEEVEEYQKKLWRDLYPRLVRYWNIVSKAKMDGQGQLFSCHGELIDDESAARGYVEAFAKHEKL